FGYRLISDVPVGVFLSGGTDSTFLAAFLRRRLKADVEYLTIGFEDPDFDESAKATQIAKDLDLRHSVEVLIETECQQELLRFVGIWDEPFGDTSGIPTAILSRFARQKVKVALSADGGDELFCGYESYSAYTAQYRRMSRVPLVIRRSISGFMRQLPYR